jgi:hypothetical protein
MQELSSLNHFYGQYALGLLGKKEFEGLIFKTVLGNRRYFHFFDGDENETIDYLCWLYPRLSQAVINYKETGASFSAYISAMVRLSAREYRSRETDHHITEYAALTAQALDMEVRSPDVVYPEPERPQPRPIMNPRQIMLLVMKSYHFISEDFLDRIAPAVGMAREQLKDMMDEMQKIRACREEEIRLQQERVYCQFYRCITFEKRLCAAARDSARRQRMQGQLERAQERLAGMRKRLTGVRVDATNQQIADVLGIAKGSVASGLFAVRSHWRSNEAGTAVEYREKPQNLPPRNAGQDTGALFL